MATASKCSRRIDATEGIYTSPSGARHLGSIRTSISGDVLGDQDIDPQALQFLRELVVGKRVTIAEDGWRLGDSGVRRYVYAFLPDQTVVNAVLIRRDCGYADLKVRTLRRDEFIALEEGAWRQTVDVWLR